MVATVLSLQLFAEEKVIVIEAPQANPEIMIDQIETSTLILHATAFQESMFYSQNLEKQLFLLTQSSKPLKTRFFYQWLDRTTNPTQSKSLS
jgi:hypothetical protein